MEQSNEYSEGYQYSQSYEMTEGTDHDNTDPNFGDWQMFGQAPEIDHPYQDVSVSATSEDQTSFGFLQQPENADPYNQHLSAEEINPEIDYETIVRSRQLYYDPEPQIIRKPATTKPVVYNQNIKVRFLQPPPVPQGHLIIREVRPPQPPPPPPLVSFDFRLSNCTVLYLNRLFVNVHHLLHHHLP
jgi:hypothetical protein